MYSIAREGDVSTEFANPRWCGRDDERRQKWKISEDNEERSFVDVVKDVRLRFWRFEDVITSENAEDECHDANDHKNREQ